MFCVTRRGRSVFVKKSEGGYAGAFGGPTPHGVPLPSRYASPRVQAVSIRSGPTLWRDSMARLTAPLENPPFYSHGTCQAVRFGVPQGAAGPIGVQWGAKRYGRASPCYALLCFDRP